MSQFLKELVQHARQQVREVNMAHVRHYLDTQPAGIIDVREPQEFASGSLPMAVNIPRGVLEFQIAAHFAQTYPLLLCCDTGCRSALAAVSLQQLGYTNVSFLSGGYNAWLAAGQHTPTRRNPT